MDANLKSSIIFTNEIARRHIESMGENLKEAFRHYHYAKQWLMLTESTVTTEKPDTHLDRVQPPPDVIKL